MKIIILISLIASNAFSADTLPFRIKRISTDEPQLFVLREAKRSNANIKGTIVDAQSKEDEIVQVSTEKIKKTVADIRSSVCTIIKKGHIKIWFVATAKGEFVVSESSVEGGMEVQFDCE